MKCGDGRRREKNSAMSVGFKVDTNVETLSGMVEVLDTGGDTCDRDVSLKECQLNQGHREIDLR